MGERWPGSAFQIFGATDENELEVATEVLSKETHINPYTVKGGGGNDPWLTFLLITFER